MTSSTTDDTTTLVGGELYQALGRLFVAQSGSTMPIYDGLSLYFETPDRIDHFAAWYPAGSSNWHLSQPHFRLVPDVMRPRIPGRYVALPSQSSHVNYTTGVEHELTTDEASINLLGSISNAVAYLPENSIFGYREGPSSKFVAIVCAMDNVTDQLHAYPGPDYRPEPKIRPLAVRGWLHESLVAQPPALWSPKPANFQALRASHHLIAVDELIATDEGDLLHVADGDGAYIYSQLTNGFKPGHYFQITVDGTRPQSRFSSVSADALTPLREKALGAHGEKLEATSRLKLLAATLSP